MQHLEPCPMCGSTQTVIEANHGNDATNGICLKCGARGPRVGLGDPRPREDTAAIQWNAWAFGTIELWNRWAAKPTEGERP